VIAVNARQRLPSVPTCWLLMPGTRAAEDIARHRAWVPCRSRVPPRAALAVLGGVRASCASLGVLAALGGAAAWPLVARALQGEPVRRLAVAPSVAGRRICFTI